MRRADMGNERGIALGVVILSAIMFSAAAVAVLQMSMNSSQTSDFHEQRLRARYAAEAGLVWAMQKLWADPSECFPGSPDFTLDSDDNPATPDEKVDISVDGPCPAANLTLKAKVVY